MSETQCLSCNSSYSSGESYCPTCGEELIELPTEFTLSATGRGSGREKCGFGDLPRVPELADKLRYYPGEVIITYRMDKNLDIEPVEIEHNGTIWTPTSETDNE